jgi:anthranilate synthase component I
VLIRPTIMAIFDSVKDEVTVTSPVYADPACAARAAYVRAQERISEIVDALDRPLDHRALSGDGRPADRKRRAPTPRLRSTRRWC